MMMSNNNRKDGSIEDDYDYMSSSFVADSHKQNVDTTTDTSKYSKSRTKRQKVEPSKIVPLKEREKVAREQGLNKPIEESNIGFKLLQLMGYKKGMALGKGDNQDALVEPLKVEIRTNKEGLGVAEDRKRKKEDQEAQHLVYSAELVSQFKTRMRDKFNERKLTSDVKQMLSIIKQLDHEKVVLSNQFYKNENEYTSEEEEESHYGVVEQDKFKSLQLTEKILALSAYLQETHYYCFYCGNQYESIEKLRSKCPGLIEEDHE